MKYIHFHQIDDNPESNKHLSEIVDSIKANGWRGLPLLANGDNLLNGCHRATACKILGIEPEVHQIELACTWGDDEYADCLLDALCDARSGDEVLKAMKDLYAMGYIDKLSVDIMQAECDKE